MNDSCLRAPTAVDRHYLSTADACNRVEFHVYQLRFSKSISYISFSLSPFVVAPGKTLPHLVEARNTYENITKSDEDDSRQHAAVRSAAFIRAPPQWRVRSRHPNW